MKLGTLFLLSAMAAIAVSCGSDDEVAPASPRVPAPTAATPIASATATPTVDISRSGIASVDAAIDAVLAGDADGLRRLLRYTPTRCQTAPQQVGSPPPCRASEADGTLVDVLSVLHCEGVYQREGELDLGFDGSPFPPVGSSLYAVYRSGPTTFPPSQYTVIFSRPGSGSGFGTAFALEMSDDGVVGVSHGCAGTIDEFLQYGHFTDVIVPPR